MFPGLILLAAIIVRIHTVGYGFVYDDNYFLFNQPAVIDQDHSLEWLMQPLHGLYRPVRSIVYALITPVTGHNPAPYRLIGIALDGLMALLLFQILQLFFNAKPAFFASLIWLFHPTHSERVVLIIGSFDIWGMAAMMAALLCASRLLVYKKDSRKDWIGVGVFTTLAVFANEEALLLPVYFGALALVHCGVKDLMKNRRIMKLLILIGLVCGVYMLVRVGVIGLWSRVDAPPVDSGGSLFPIMLAIVHYMFFTTLLPVDLHEVYPPFTFTGIAHWETAAGLLIAAFMLCLALWGLLKRHYLGAAAAWWLAGILPFSNIVANVEQRHVRYLYMPTLALALCAAYWHEKSSRANGNRRKTFAVIATFILVCFFTLAVKQNRVYRDSLSLWGDSYANCGNCSKAAINYGIALAKTKQFAKAEEVLGKVLVLRPGYEMAFVALAAVEMDQDRKESALALLEKALEINPRHAQARHMYESIKNSPY